MKRIPKAIYKTAAEIDADIADLKLAADSLPDGPGRQDLLKEISQLSMFAEAKRWIESPGLKPSA